MGRVKSLDSLRGIAALVVVLYHFSLVVPELNHFIDRIYPLRIFIAGQTAVYIFFVLSGFVLYLSLDRHNKDRYSIFAIRRIMRLYPPVAVAVLLSAFLYIVIEPKPIIELKGWVTSYSWTDYPSADVVFGHLLLLDTDRYHALDNPMWSLVVEVRLSLIFPVLAACIRLRPALTLIACLVISWICRYSLNHGHILHIIDPYFTGQFLDLFAIGAILARYHKQVSGFFANLPRNSVMLATYIVLCAKGTHSIYYMYLCSIMIVSITFSYKNLSRFYDSKPLVWLGKRSFSLYLIHVPLLLALLYALHERVPVIGILACALPVSLIGAEIFWRCVERPSMLASKLVSQRLTTLLAN